MINDDARNYGAIEHNNVNNLIFCDETGMCVSIIYPPGIIHSFIHKKLTWLSFIIK